MKKTNIIILPAKGDRDINEAHWYHSVRLELESLGLLVTASNMPDPEIARLNIWQDHIAKHLQPDTQTIIIGHSLGAVAALRFATHHRLFGLVLAGVSHLDFGESDKAQSDYFDSPWEWDKITKNTNWIVQFASQDDNHIPINDARFVYQQLNCEYHEYTDRGHFGSEYREESSFPEVIEVIKRKLNI